MCQTLLQYQHFIVKSLLPQTFMSFLIVITFIIVKVLFFIIYMLVWCRYIHWLNIILIYYFDSCQKCALRNPFFLVRLICHYMCCSFLNYFPVQVVLYFSTLVHFMSTIFVVLVNYGISTLHMIYFRQGGIRTYFLLRYEIPNVHIRQFSIWYQVKLTNKNSHYT